MANNDNDDLISNSFQGSHVTAHCATYLLQWKFFDRPAMHSHSPLDVIDSITGPHHKAKVMYYYEVKQMVCLLTAIVVTFIHVCARWATRHCPGLLLSHIYILTLNPGDVKFLHFEDIHLYLYIG